MPLQRHIWCGRKYRENGVERAWWKGNSERWCVCPGQEAQWSTCEKDETKGRLHARQVIKGDVRCSRNTKVSNPNMVSDHPLLQQITSEPDCRVLWARRLNHPLLYAIFSFLTCSNVHTCLHPTVHYNNLFQFLIYSDIVTCLHPTVHHIMICFNFYPARTFWLVCIPQSITSWFVSVFDMLKHNYMFISHSPSHYNLF